MIILSKVASLVTILSPGVKTALEIISITSSKPAPNKIRDSSTFKCLLIAFRNDGEPVSDSRITHLSALQLFLLHEVMVHINFHSMLVYITHLLYQIFL